MCVVFLWTSACSIVGNDPLSRYAQPTFRLPSEPMVPIRVAVRTSFANGSKAAHFKRSNDISVEMAERLNKEGSPAVTFFPVQEFDNLANTDYDYLLEMKCDRPRHETVRNKPLLLLGWPATLSIIAAPLGIMVLSIPGIVKEVAVFDWSVRISPKHFQSFTLAQEKIDSQEAVVSATAWTTSEEALEESYRNADSHMKGATISFISGLEWEELGLRVERYAQKHSTTPAPERMGTSGLAAQLLGGGHLDNRFAVVVGISHYKFNDSGGLTDLRYADDDATAIYKMIQKRGWSENNIKLLVNDKATKREVSIALESWLTKANEDDLILLFWAGHAYPDPEDPQKVYFACYDTNIKIPSTGFRMDHVRRILEERQARNVLVIADTCHAGKLITRGERGISVTPYLDKLKKADNLPKGWVFMVGAESDRKAVEDVSWRNGAFTHVLLDGVAGKADGFQSSGAKDNVITLGEIRAYMNSEMPSETLQVLGVAKHPIITTSSGDPSIWQLPFLKKEE